MSIEEQLELLKSTVSYYAHDTQNYDFGYRARQTLVSLITKTTDGDVNEAREL